MNQTIEKMSRVVIIGGGISGLAAAYRLCERLKDSPTPTQVLLLESNPHPGGTIRTFERDGFLLEGGPDNFITEKPEAVELARQLGIAHRLIETNSENRRAFIVRDGRLRPVPEGFQLLAPSRFWPFLTTDIFSWTGKARMALDLLLPRRAGSNGADDESLAQFVRRRLGREALERMAQPMVGGIYTADPELLSLRSTMPRFLDMERTHRSLLLGMWKNRRRQSAKEQTGTSGARYGLFLTFDRGMQVLVEELVRQLPPEVIQPNVKVVNISYKSGEWVINIDGQETLSADAVCLALPAYAAGSLLESVDDELTAELSTIAYASSAIINFAFRREDIAHPLDGFGFVTPFIEGRTVLACSFSSIKYAGRAPAGHVLLRAFLGGAMQPELFNLDDAEMQRRALDDLRSLLGLRAEPLFAQITRWPRSMAQYHVGHREKIARVYARLDRFPSLALAGNAYSGAGIPDCVRGGFASADKIHTFLNQSF